MSNDEVIAILESILDELTARRDELEEKVNTLDGPLEELITLERRLDERLTSLNTRIRHIRFRLRERKLARDLDQAVSPLSASRKSALEKALVKVSESISATNTVKRTIQLAQEISDAASRADDAAMMV
jgi:chromosome segregation ATPase